MKAYVIKPLLPGEREAEKQASRDADDRALKDELVSPEQLRQANGFFTALPVERFRIVEIGGRPIDELR